MSGRRQFDKSLADTLVKQVKTKTTLKVRPIASASFERKLTFPLFTLVLL